MDWQSYEKIVKNIYLTLGKAHGVALECYGNNCKREGHSGVQHQIDVLTSHSDGIHTYMTAIECKYWNEKINKDIVMKAAEIIQDCNITRGVIVTKLGYTPDAIQYAKHKNISIVILNQPNYFEDAGEVYNTFLMIENSKLVCASIVFKIDKSVSKQILKCLRTTTISCIFNIPRELQSLLVFFVLNF